jgi:hypothetical protein
MSFDKIYSLSAIIICRNHLDLQRRNWYPNTNTSQGLPTITIGSFHAAVQRMHHAVMAEFGDPNDVSVEAETSQEVVVHADPDVPAAIAEDDVRHRELGIHSTR